MKIDSSLRRLLGAAGALPLPAAGVTQGLQAEMCPTGTLRVGINLGNPVIAQANPGGGDPKGVGPALGRELASRLGVGLQYLTYDTAGKLADAVKAGAWDVAFLAVDPARAVDIDFTAPYVHIEGTYVVRDGAPYRTVADVDADGVRIAVGLKTAYDLFLTREIRHAQLVRSESSVAALEAFLAEGLEAAAGVRQPLGKFAAQHPGLRVLDESFMVIRQAAGVPKGRPGAAAFLGDFIEDAKRTGFVQRALAESGVGEVTIAPPAS